MTARMPGRLRDPPDARRPWRAFSPRPTGPRPPESPPFAKAVDRQFQKAHRLPSSSLSWLARTGDMPLPRESSTHRSGSRSAQSAELGRSPSGIDSYECPLFRSLEFIANGGQIECSSAGARRSNRWEAPSEGNRPASFSFVVSQRKIALLCLRDLTLMTLQRYFSQMGSTLSRIQGQDQRRVIQFWAPRRITDCSRRGDAAVVGAFRRASTALKNPSPAYTSMAD